MEKIEIVRGDSAIISFPITDKAGTKLDMSSISEMYLTCRENPSKVYDIIFQKSLTDFEFDSTNKVFKVTIDKEDTQAIDINQRVGEVIPLYFDIEVTLTNGLRKSKIVSLNIVKDYTIHGGEENGD